ncbi:MAG TPA: hypothetical protein PKG52_01620 [bacterium]|nr:hypothetical protein [bacterium]HPS29291.1 hypothetical protein [bacterium]
MKKFSSLVVTVLFFLFFLSCGDKSTQKNDSELQSDDEVAETENEPDEDVSDADEPVPNKPGDDFFSDPLNVQYTFKGYINDYSVVNTDEEQKGSMELSLKVGDLELTLNDIPTSYTYTYPETAPENQRGKTVVAVVSAGGVAQENGLQTYYLFINSFNVDKLKELKSNNIREFSAKDAEAGVNLNKYYVKARADGSRVYRKCLIGMSPVENKSRFFINNSSNKDFAVSETMLAWGNVEVTIELNPEVTKTLTEYEGEFCSFSLDGAPLTKDEYEAELIKDMTKFDCEMEEDFLTPISEKYGTMKIKGKISPAQSDKSTIGQAIINLENKDVVLDSLFQIQSGTDSVNEVLTLDSAGDIETISGQTHYKYKYFQAIVPKPFIKELKNAGEESVLIEDVLGHESVSAILYSVEEKQLTAKTLQKVCIMASPSKTPASKMFLCFKNNTEFAAGEEFQGAVNIALNNDEEYLLEEMNAETVAELCYCSSYTTTTYTPAENCDEFENTNP